MFDNFKKLFRRPISQAPQKTDETLAEDGHLRQTSSRANGAAADTFAVQEGDYRYQDGDYRDRDGDFRGAREGDISQTQKEPHAPVERSEYAKFLDTYSVPSDRSRVDMRKPEPLALTAPGRGRNLDFDAESIEHLSTAELSAVTASLRSDILSRARTAVLREGGSRRQDAVRIAAMEKAAGEAAKETFVSSGILSLDKSILETVPFASDEDKAKMAQLAEIGQARHSRDMTKLRADMKEQGFNLHEVASLKNPTWINSYATAKDPKSIARFTRGEIVSMASSQNSTARTSAALKEAILGRVDETKPDRDYLVIATPLEENVNQQKFEAGFRMRRADTRLRHELGSVAPNADDLRRSKLMAVSTSDPMSAPAAMKAVADKNRHLDALQSPQR